MSSRIIKAISFFYKGERVIVKANNLGRFRIPVTELVNGKIRTTHKNLTARQVIEHDIIKNCDPTLYLTRDEKMRVYHGGDPNYLPAAPDGVITKHDSALAERKSFKIKTEKKIHDPIADEYKHYMQTEWWGVCDDWEM